MYLQIAYACFLQLRHLEVSSATQAINLIFLIICFAVVLPIPFIIYYILKSPKYESYHVYFKSYYAEMHAPELRLLIYFRKFIYSCVVILGFHHPFIQMPFIVLGTFPVGAFIIKQKPFENKFWNKKNALIEILFTACTILFFPLFDAQIMEEPSRESVGWAIFTLFYLISFIEIINVFVGLYDKIKEFLAKRKLKKEEEEKAKI